MAVGQVSGYQGNASIDFLENGFDQKIKVYNGTGAAVNNGKVYILSFDATYGATISTPATSSVPQHVVVIDNSELGQSSIAAGAYGYAVYRGYATVACANTIAAGDFLGAANASTTAADAGTSRTANSFGIALTAYSGGSCTAILFGDTVTI